MASAVVATGEIGPDAINVGESCCPGSGLSTERSGNVSRPTGGCSASQQAWPHAVQAAPVMVQPHAVPRHPVY